MRKVTGVASDVNVVTVYTHVPAGGATRHCCCGAPPRHTCLPRVKRRRAQPQDHRGGQQQADGSDGNDDRCMPLFITILQTSSEVSGTPEPCRQVVWRVTLAALTSEPPLSGQGKPHPHQNDMKGEKSSCINRFLHTSIIQTARRLLN